MTPPATARTPRRSASGLRRSPVRHPRRVSGPSGPVRSAAAAAVAIPVPGIALPGERKRRPVPSPRRQPARKPTRQAQGAPGIALRAIDTFDGIARSAFVDRLIRGRLWIGLLAFALIGIVAMQLLVLKLNTGIGHTLGRVATLQRENAQLGIEDSMYSAEGRIAPLAAAAGMTLAPAGTIHFVVASNADVSRAVAALSTATQPSASGSSGASSPPGAESSASTASSGTEAGTSSGANSQTSSSGNETANESSSSTGAGPSGSEAAAGSSESSSSTGSSSRRQHPRQAPPRLRLPPRRPRPRLRTRQLRRRARVPRWALRRADLAGGTQAGVRE